MSKLWNRSSQWSVEQLATFNDITSKAVTEGVEFFDRASAGLGLTADELHEAKVDVMNQITTQIAAKIEGLKTYRN